MPIYEYRCDACGHELEVMQRMNDERLKTCPACGRDELRKLVSAAGFQLKGTGWYETDFKNKGKQPDKKEGAGEKPKDAGKSDKPAAKKDGAATSD